MTVEEKRQYHADYHRRHYIPHPIVCKPPKIKTIRVPLTYEEKYARYRARYIANKELYAERRKAWRRDNPERARELNRRALAKISPEKKRETRLRYNAENPERVKVWRARRRADKKNAEGTYTFEQWMARVAFHGWSCVYCHSGLTPETLVIEHMIPLCRGGTNWPSNLAPACGSCNNKKYISTYKEYVGLVAFAGWKRRSR